MNQSGSPLLLFYWPKLTSIYTLPPLASHLRDQNSPFLMFNQKLAQRERPLHRTQNKRKYQMMQDLVVFLGCVGLNLGKRYISRNIKYLFLSLLLLPLGKVFIISACWNDFLTGDSILPLSGLLKSRSLLPQSCLKTYPSFTTVGIFIVLSAIKVTPFSP